MRAREFITERLITHGDNQFKIERLEPGDEEYADMKVSVLDDWGNEAGFAKFASDGKDLDPRALKVNDRYRGQGFAKLIYDFMKSKGYRIIRSWDQTDDGKHFWDKNRGEDVRVWESENSQIVYHVTPTKNVRSIMRHGLKPIAGDRTSQIAGEKSGIYVFPNKMSAEDAVMNWLGDEFDEEPLTLLQVNISGLDEYIQQGADYELIVDTSINPTRIKVLPDQL